jgi:hypothetical protein
MLIRRAVAALAATVLLAAACGDQDGEEAAPATTSSTVAASTTTTGATTTTTVATTTTTVATDPALVARAEAAVLRAGDFPPDAGRWEAEPPEEGLDLEIVWRDIVQCLAVDPGPPLASATSPTFRRDLATQVRTTVEHRSEQSAMMLADALAGPRYPECARNAFAADADRSKPEGATPGPVQVSPLPVAQRGQRTVASRVNLTMNLDDLQVPIFQDLIVVFDAGRVVRLLFLNPGGAFPENLRASLTDKVLARA